VEQTRVGDGIEGPADILHIEGILHQECDGKIPLPRFFPGKSIALGTESTPQTL
jgi:hypothetical protein